MACRLRMLTITDKNFEDEVINSKISVLVDFWAEWCSPCLMVAPIIEGIAKEYEGKIKVGKLNVDENPQMAAKYGVMSIPTVILFKDGKEIGRKVGFEGKEAYLKLISEK